MVNRTSTLRKMNLMILAVSYSNPHHDPFDSNVVQLVWFVDLIDRCILPLLQVGMFFLYTVVLFAWVAATIFDDEEAGCQFGGCF